LIAVLKGSQGILQLECCDSRSQQQDLKARVKHTPQGPLEKLAAPKKRFPQLQRNENRKQDVQELITAQLPFVQQGLLQLPIPPNMY
jgi:hypothetical protein